MPYLISLPGDVELSSFGSSKSELISVGAQLLTYIEQLCVLGPVPDFGETALNRRDKQTFVCRGTILVGDIQNK